MSGHTLVTHVHAHINAYSRGDLHSYIHKGRRVLSLISGNGIVCAIHLTYQHFMTSCPNNDQTMFLVRYCMAAYVGLIICVLYMTMCLL